MGKDPGLVAPTQNQGPSGWLWRKPVLAPYLVLDWNVSVPDEGAGCLAELREPSHWGFKGLFSNFTPSKKDEEWAFIGRKVTQVECHIDKQLMLMMSRR